MTFEQFKGLAENPPMSAGASIYRLRCLYADGVLDYRGEKRYPKYDVRYSPDEFFFSLEDAEARIARMGQTPGDDIVLCYFIDQLPISTGEYAGEHGVISWRRYDSEGQMACKSLCSELFCHNGTEYGIFLGRDDSGLSEGDIVEVLDESSMTMNLEVITATVPSTAWVWETMKRSMEKRGDCLNLDFTDDSFTCCDTTDLSNHTHISTKLIFRPHFKIPDRTLTRLQNVWQTLKSRIYN